MKVITYCIYSSDANVCVCVFDLLESMSTGTGQSIGGDLQNDFPWQQRAAGESVWPEFPKLWQDRTVQP